MSGIQDNISLQCRKFISVILVFAQLIQVTGCVSSKRISASELNGSGIKVCQVKSPQQDFVLHDVKIRNGILSGTYDTDNSAISGEKIKITVPSDTLIKLFPGRRLELDLSSATSIDKKEVRSGHTVFIIGGVLLVVIVVIGVVGFQNLDWSRMWQ